MTSTNVHTPLGRVAGGSSIGGTALAATTIGVSAVTFSGFSRTLFFARRDRFARTVFRARGDFFARIDLRTRIKALLRKTFGTGISLSNWSAAPDR
jgi:hypothetical protein